MTKVLSLKLTSEQLTQLLEMVRREECELCGEQYEGWIGEIDDFKWKHARLNTCKEIKEAIKKTRVRFDTKLYHMASKTGLKIKHNSTSKRNEKIRLWHKRLKRKEE